MSKEKPVAEDVNDVPMGNDLDQLRTILFGNQARAMEKRINDLELRLETVRRELNQHFDERLDALAESTAVDLAKTQKELNEQLTNQVADQTKQNKELQERLDKLAADFGKQLQTTQKELAQQMDKQFAELNHKLLEFQSEARQGDDDLRIEMLSLGAMLDNQKAGRSELADMLVQMSEQLKGNVKNTAVPKEKKS